MERLFVHCCQIKLEFGVLAFVERAWGKPENPEKNPRSKDENHQQTQPTYGTGQVSNPGHIGGKRALSPLRHPCSPSFSFIRYEPLRTGRFTTFKLDRVLCFIIDDVWCPSEEHQNGVSIQSSVKLGETIFFSGVVRTRPEARSHWFPLRVCRYPRGMPTSLGKWESPVPPCPPPPTYQDHVISCDWQGCANRLPQNVYHGSTLCSTEVLKNLSLFSTSQREPKLRILLNKTIFLIYYNLVSSFEVGFIQSASEYIQLFCKTVWNRISYY